MIQIHQNLINFVRPTPHSKYGPSSADRWMSCAASIKLSEGIPNFSSAAAEEGTLAHSVCEAVYRQKQIGIPIPVDLTFQMLALKDKGDEMMAAAQGYYEVCDFWVNNKDLIGDVLWFGQERGIPVFPDKGCFGTGDFIIVGSKASVVIDFKYGRKAVKATSAQLKVYAAGIARHINQAPTTYKFYAVVYQPRVSHEVSECHYTITEMYQYLGVIEAAIDKCERLDNEPIEGKNYCWFCPANQTKDINKKCKIKAEKPIKIAKERFDVFLKDANIYPDTVVNKIARDQAIVKLMALKPAIDEIVKQSSDEFMTRLDAGELIPGIGIRQKVGKRVYNAVNDEDAAKMINTLFPEVEAMKTVTKTTVRTITDIEKEVGKNKLDEICVKKLSKEVQVQDETMKNILQSMNALSIKS